MNSRPDGQTELVSLIERLLAQRLDPRGIERLNALLESNERARSLYLDYAELHAWLTRRYAMGAGPPEENAPAGQAATAPRRNPVGARLMTLLAIAASLLAAAGWEIARRDTPEASNLPVEHEASLEGVAVFSRQIDAAWGRESVRADVGDAFPAGTLVLDSGVVQIDFFSGAVAVVEGPAVLNLISPMSAELIAGKLRASVPSRARGFSITTASGTLVDLGTEFALNLEQKGQAGEVHVIEGEVRFDPAEGVGKSTHQLLEGDALRFDSGGVVSEAPKYAAESFVGLSQVESLARRRSERRREEWERWREGWFADPDLMAWYAYSPEPAWSRTFRNHAQDASPDSHGVVVGCEWTTGRWPGERALRYRNASHRVSINLPGQRDSLTLAMWLNIEKLHPRNQVALMHPEAPQPRILHWTLDRSAQGALLHLSETTLPPDARPSRGDKPYRRHYNSFIIGVQNSDLGRWVHLAVVYDAQARKVSHYCDGRLLALSRIDEPRKLEIGNADLGNWPYKNWARGTKYESRHLTGEIDEFVVVGRALTSEEISEMHTMGSP